ncbi:anaerobic ribonucleoside-triphosphate reductase [Acidiferrobacter sp.]|uniref:anaerobic ribonucleoside-triphosphate reductase n=1 Tax=Acidiferrobacter sp. TaxID=1872107 RepID=UPI002621215A|nr:anaerobic ribonucleoside-triphosphate reductase [Acidiferrobacter sp.]
MNEAISDKEHPGGDLRPEERQVCEVWTRVMGYHRPVASFNEGKKGEHYERQFFVEDRRSA